MGRAPRRRARPAGRAARCLDHRGCHRRADGGGEPRAGGAALAALDVYREERLLEGAKKLEPVWAEAAMGLKGLPHVLDIRTIGLVAGIDLASRPDAVGGRAYEAMQKGFEQGIMMRITGDTIALSPPLIVRESEISEIFDKLARVIRGLN